jgi:hypothetical protein
MSAGFCVIVPWAGYRRTACGLCVVRVGLAGFARLWEAAFSGVMARCICRWVRGMNDLALETLSCEVKHHG